MGVQPFWPVVVTSCWGSSLERSNGISLFCVAVCINSTLTVCHGSRQHPGGLINEKNNCNQKVVLAVTQWKTENHPVVLSFSGWTAGHRNKGLQTFTTGGWRQNRFPTLGSPAPIHKYGEVRYQEMCWAEWAKACKHSHNNVCEGRKQGRRLFIIGLTEGTSSCNKSHMGSILRPSR